MISLIDRSDSAMSPADCPASNIICVGYRVQFELLDEQTGDSLRVIKIDSPTKVLYGYQYFVLIRLCLFTHYGCYWHSSSNLGVLGRRHTSHSKF